MKKLIAILALVSLSAGCFGQAPNPAPQTSNSASTSSANGQTSSPEIRDTRFEIRDSDLIRYQHSSPDFSLMLPVGSYLNSSDQQMGTSSLVSLILPSVVTSSEISAPVASLSIAFGKERNTADMYHGAVTSTVTFNNRDFIYSSGLEGAAGTEYRSYFYSTPWQNGVLTFYFLISHVSSCEVYGDPSKCLPFDQARDTAIFGKILSSLSDAALADDGTLSFSDVVWDESEKLYETTIRYPQFFLGQEPLKDLNDLVYANVSSTASDYRMDAATMKDYPSDNPWRLDMGYYLPYTKNGILSLLMEGYGYTGGAHGMTFYRNYLYDLNNKKILSLSDLFKPDSDWLNFISAYCIKELSLSDVSDIDWVNQGAGPDPENYMVYYLAPEGLHIVFNSYQVAAYAAGPQDILLSWEMLTPLLK